MLLIFCFNNEKDRRELGWEPLDVLTNYKV